MARINSWKNRLVMSFTKLLSRPKPAPSELKRILIVSTTALGDTLWATPAIANIRFHYPNATLAVLTSPIGMQVLSQNPHINQFILLRDPLFPKFIFLLRKLREERFDVALLLHSSQRLILPLLTLSGIPRIIGTTGKNKGLDTLLTDPLPPQKEHEIERRARITQVLGIPTKVETLSYFIHPQERQECLLRDNATPKIALHLGAREAFRRFPKPLFIALGKSLIEQFNCSLFLTGTPEETPLLQEVAGALPKARIVIEPFRKFAAFLEQMDLVICTDTGPLHLACALDLPVIALFASSDPQLFGPYKATHAHILARPSTCSPCLKRRCLEPFCYLQISIKDILKECEKLLKKST